MLELRNKTSPQRLCSAGAQLPCPTWQRLQVGKASFCMPQQRLGMGLGLREVGEALWPLKMKLPVICRAISPWRKAQRCWFCGWFLHPWTWALRGSWFLHPWAWALSRMAFHMLLVHTPGGTESRTLGCCLKPSGVVTGGYTFNPSNREAKTGGSP